MQHFAKNITIEAPVEKVYSIVADVTKYPEFLPGVESVKVEGDLVTMVGKLGPISMSMKNKARFTENKSIDLDLVEGPFKAMKAKWSFEDLQGSTSVSYTADYELSMALRMPGVKNAVAAGLQSNVEQVMAAFRKRIIG